MGLFFVREREAAVIEKIDLAACKARFAGSASPRAATMWISDTVGERSLQDGDAFLHRDGAASLAYVDIFRHGFLSDLLGQPERRDQARFLQREGAV